MHNGHDPMEASRRADTGLKLSRQKVVPSVHVLERRRRKRLGRAGQKVLLQTARQIVRVGKEKVLRQIDHLEQPLVSQLGYLTIAHTQSDAALATIPHRQQHR